MERRSGVSLLCCSFILFHLCHLSDGVLCFNCVSTETPGCGKTLELSLLSASTRTRRESRTASSSSNDGTIVSHHILNSDVPFRPTKTGGIGREDDDFKSKGGKTTTTTTLNPFRFLHNVSNVTHSTSQSKSYNTQETDEYDDIPASHPSKKPGTRHSTSNPRLPRNVLEFPILDNNNSNSNTSQGSLTTLRENYQEAVHPPATEVSREQTPTSDHNTDGTTTAESDRDTDTNDDGMYYSFQDTEQWVNPAKGDETNEVLPSDDGLARQGHYDADGDMDRPRDMDTGRAGPRDRDKASRRLVVECPGHTCLVQRLPSSQGDIFVRTCDTSQVPSGQCHLVTQVLGARLSVVCVCTGDLCNQNGGSGATRNSLSWTDIAQAPLQLVVIIIINMWLVSMSTYTLGS